MKKTGLAALLTLALLLACAPAALAAEHDLLDSAETALPAPQECPDVPVDEGLYQEEPPSRDTAPSLSGGIPGRGEVGDIYQYWEENGYPDYVSYAYAAGGEVRDGVSCTYWEIGLVDAGEEQRQEVLDLVSPAGLVTFYPCSYTHAQKVDAFEQVSAMAQEDENIRQVVFGRNTETVWVGVPDGMEKEYAHYLIRECGFGALVSVTDVGSLNALVELNTRPGGGLDGMIDPVITIGGSPKQGAAPFLWPFAIAAAAVTGGALLLLRGRMLLRRTADGHTVSGPSPVSRKRVVQVIRDNPLHPSVQTRYAILRRLEQEWCQ